MHVLVCICMGAHAYLLEIIYQVSHFYTCVCVLEERRESVVLEQDYFGQVGFVSLGWQLI